MKIFGMTWKLYSNLCTLCVLILFTSGFLSCLTSCAATDSTLSSDQKTAALQIKSRGIEKDDEKDKAFYLYFVQYSIDGKLIQAHQIKQDYDRLIKLAPGVHNLFIEYAHRGMLNARALLQKEGECYTFAVADGQTVLFEGKALSKKEWQAIGFKDVESSMKKCTLKQCQTP